MRKVVTFSVLFLIVATLVACSKSDDGHGEAAAEHASDAVEHTKAAGAEISATAGSAVDAASETAAQVGEAASDAYDEAGEMASDAADKAGEMVDDAADATGDAYDSAKQSAEDKAKEVAKVSDGSGS